VEKGAFYLAHPSLRHRVVRLGHLRCTRSGYDYDTRIRQVLDQLPQS